jgi:hypothetical protein
MGGRRPRRFEGELHEQRSLGPGRLAPFEQRAQAHAVDLDADGPGDATVVEKRGQDVDVRGRLVDPKLRLQP